MRNKYLWAAISWTAAITVACLVSAANFEGLENIEMPAKDKILHGFFYFVFTFLWHQAFISAKAFIPTRARLIAFLLGTGYGILMEVCQWMFTNDRSPDVADALANTTGSTIALLVLWLIQQRKNINNQSPAL